MRDDCGVGRRAWRRREQCGSHGGDGCSLLLLFKSGGGGKFTIRLTMYILTLYVAWMSSPATLQYDYVHFDTLCSVDVISRHIMIKKLGSTCRLDT